MYNVPKTHFSLEEYWDVLQISECHGYGLRNIPDERAMGCREAWNQDERHWLAFSIQKAEHRLAADRWLGFPLRREYNDGKGPRQLEYAFPLYLGKYVRGVGVETEVAIETSYPVELRSGGVINDPVILEVPVEFTDSNEVLVRYPEVYFARECRNYTIRPSCVTISGGVATIEIPRCRLLKPEYFRNYENPTDRPNYAQDSYFLDTVDVVRNYLNTQTGANFVWRKHGNQLNCFGGVVVCDPIDPCSDVQQLACSYVRDQRNGIVQLQAAVYQSGAWVHQPFAIRRQPDGVLINYMRGYYDRYEEVDADIARAIIAIAHNNMPRDYCKCSVQERYFKQDTEPLEPPVRLGLGPSTWGIYEASEIIREFDARYNSHMGGML